MKGLDLRIVNKSVGWHIEIKCKKWYGKIHWKPLIFWRGTKESFGFRSEKKADEVLMQEIRLNIIHNSRKIDVKIK